MKKFIPIEELVEKEKLDYLQALENNPFLITAVKIRNIDCSYFTNSKRTLWQAVGIEHIEPEMLDFIDSMEEGSVFYDIGASNGIFSVYAAKKNINVYAFEPEAQNFALLAMNCYLNSASKHQANIFNIAISNTKEVGKIYIEKYEPGGHLKVLDEPIRANDASRFEAVFVQQIIKYDIDGFIKEYSLPIPNYIKIDIDGSELDALCGMREMLKSGAVQKIFIEIGDLKEDTPEILALLKSYNYHIESRHPLQNYDNWYNYIFRRHRG